MLGSRTRTRVPLADPLVTHHAHVAQCLAADGHTRPPKWRGRASAAIQAAPELAGRSVVELGAGVGVVSVAVAMLGARVLATDADAVALAAAEHTAGANADAVAASGGECETEAFAWGGAPGDRVTQMLEGDAGADRPGLDFVLAADVLYSKDAVEPLLRTVRCSPSLARARSPRLDR